MAMKTRQSFNAKFWCEKQRRLADRINGLQQADFQNRANQLMTLTIPLSALTDNNNPLDGTLLAPLQGAENSKICSL